MQDNETLSLILSKLNTVDELAAKMKDMSAELKKINVRLNALEEDMSDTKNEVSQMREEQTSFRAYVENIIEKKIDVMVEAQVTYEQQLPPIRQLQRDVEFLKLDVDALKTFMKEKAS